MLYESEEVECVAEIKCSLCQLLECVCMLFHQNIVSPDIIYVMHGVSVCGRVSV